MTIHDALRVLGAVGAVIPELPCAQCETPTSEYRGFFYRGVFFCEHYYEHLTPDELKAAVHDHQEQAATRARLLLQQKDEVNA